MQAHFDGLVECLVRAWQPPVTNAGFIIIRPTVTIYGESITTKCGDSGINAFWCSADQQIYFSSQLPDRLSALRGKWAADVVMAHEFGHLLQGRTGLFAAGIIASQSAGSEKEGLIFRRRLETQADCFSGTFIRSVSTSLNIQQTDVEEILNSYVVVGDDAGERRSQRGRRPRAVPVAALLGQCRVGHQRHRRLQHLRGRGQPGSLAAVRQPGGRGECWPLVVLLAPGRARRAAVFLIGARRR